MINDNNLVLLRGLLEHSAPRKGKNMNDTPNTPTPDVVDPTLPFVTDAPGIVVNADEVTVYVAEDVTDAPVEATPEVAPF